MALPHNEKPLWPNFIKEPIKDEIPIVFRLDIDLTSLDSSLLWPAFKTSAVAIPSGYKSFALTIKTCLKGTVNKIPINPPIADIFAISK